MMTKIHRYRRKYFGNFHDTILATTFHSFLINLAIGIGKLALGVYIASPWLLILASYYSILSLVRGQLLWKIIQLRGKETTHIEQEQCLRTYHKSGMFIIVLGISFFVWCLWLYAFQETTRYPDYVLYGIVAVAFYKIGSAIRGLFMVKKYQNLLFSAIKKIGFLDACVSIVSVQCMLLTMQKSEYATMSSALLGMAVSVLFLIIGICMVCKRQDASRKCSFASIVK